MSTMTTMGTNNTYLRNDCEFMVDCINAETGDQSSWQVFAENRADAVAMAMRQMFGFRSYYSPTTHQVYRVGRHGRIRKVLCVAMRVDVITVGGGDAN